MIAIRALTDMQQIKKEEILPRLFSLFSVKGLVIIYVAGGGKKEGGGGVKAVLDWLEGGLIFFNN